MITSRSRSVLGAGERGLAVVLAPAGQAAHDDVLVELHVPAAHGLGQRVVGEGDLAEEAGQIGLMLRQLTAHRLERLQLVDDLGVVGLEQAAPLGRDVVERLQQGLELRGVLGQDADRLGQVVERGLGGPVVRRQLRREAVQPVDGLGDVGRVLGVAGGHVAQVVEEGLERGSLPGEALVLRPR